MFRLRSVFYLCILASGLMSACGDKNFTGSCLYDNSQIQQNTCVETAVDGQTLTQEMVKTECVNASGTWQEGDGCSSDSLLGTCDTEVNEYRGTTQFFYEGYTGGASSARDSCELGGGVFN